MFNDDVLAVCPECSSNNTTITSSKIKCEQCSYDEDFVVAQPDLDNLLLKEARKTNMMIVLRRWQYAG